MCGFVGIVNYNKNLLVYESVIKTMAEKISFRGPDENGYFLDSKVLFGHNRLIVRDPKGRYSANVHIRKWYILYYCL